MVDLDVPQANTTKGRATVRRLIDSARALLADGGYVAVRVSDISEGAGLSNGAFYRYFTDKKQIMLIVIDEFLRDAEEHMHVTFEPNDPMSSVRLSTAKYLTHYAANAAMFSAVIEAGQIDPDVELIRRDSIDRWCGRITRMLTRGQANRVFRADLDPTTAGNLLGGMLESFASRAYASRGGFEVDIEHVASEATALWERGALA